MAFELTKLPYELNALEPSISQKTLEFHHGKHLQKYVDKINDLIKGTEFENSSLEDIIKKADGAIFNNGAQVWNHDFYFASFSPEGGGEPSGELSKAISDKYGSYEKFKEEFEQSCAGLFGSGWTWLIAKEDGSLDIYQGANAGNPIRENLTTILTCDVWEHAYYLDYQNKRPEYVKKFWDIIDWQVVEKRYEMIIQKQHA